MAPSFDYQRFLIRRERLAGATWAIAAAWWAALIVVAFGSDWWAPMARFKDATVWGWLTVDRLLALGAWVSVAAAVGGPWLVRHLHRPPQIFLLLRDFQSKAAAEFALSYVRRRGAAWGYWLTLENADLRAGDSIGGEAETEPEGANRRSEKLPVGGWWATSIFSGLFLTAVLLLSQLDSAVLRWMRRTADELGLIGDVAFGAIAIAGICVFWLAASLIIRGVILKLQRTAVLPRRIDSAEGCQRVLDTIVSRVRRRASTLTLGPLPVVSVDDAWWKDAVERCIAEASLVVFVLTARESAALSWEMDQVRRRFDPRRTLYIDLGEEDFRLTDGTGHPIPDTSWLRDEDRIDAAVRGMLIDTGTSTLDGPRNGETDVDEGADSC